MTTADLHTLTGAYALHALAPEERAEFERHLEACHACSQEVRELSATAARLGRAVAVTPPPALKEQVLRRIAAERQDPPKVTHRQARSGGGGRGRALSRFALAACLAAVAGLGGVAVWQNQEARDARQEARAAQRHSEELTAVLAAPDAQVATGGLTNGATGSVIVSRARDRAAFVATGMPKPPSGKVYELWYNDGGTMRAAGLLNPATGSASVLMDGPVDGASGMGITVEPAGGSEQPTSTPLALMNFPAA
ncbi:MULTISPECIES: anti-sigma factor [unclassified Streptomyces]|uniref:anti-sigma factor n=1 Tax=unclassified Streptomyces TaxID=2593676 RepID=UPI002E78FCD5|nr:anti-sigma factor [Streptomyces sp. JV176]MEE1800096.1 anti-sigma factor [Streptomyces sp. JV176]